MTKAKLHLEPLPSHFCFIYAVVFCANTLKYLFASGLPQLSSGFMRLSCYVSILRSCIMSRKEEMNTPICVLHYNNILHITIGNAIQ